MNVFYLKMYYTDYKREYNLLGTNVFLSLDDAIEYSVNKAERVLEPYSTYGEVFDFTAIIYHARITSKGIVPDGEVFRKTYNYNDFDFEIEL